MFPQLEVTVEFYLQSLQLKRGGVLTGCSLCAVLLLWCSVGYLIWQGMVQKLSLFRAVKVGGLFPVLTDLDLKGGYY